MLARRDPASKIWGRYNLVGEAAGACLPQVMCRGIMWDKETKRGARRRKRSCYDFLAALIKDEVLFSQFCSDWQLERWVVCSGTM